MSETKYPCWYGTSEKTIDELFAVHHVDKMHPEFARRLRAWLISKGGQIGIGGSWREDGSQPDKPGFAPEGKSFHQFQLWNSGLIKFAAVDLVVRNPGKVHRAPYWSEVPVQGSAEAKAWGLHCNVGGPDAGHGETWHMQPVVTSTVDGRPYDGIDGYAGWIYAGRPDPVSGYKLPSDIVNKPIVIPPIAPTEELEMFTLSTPVRIIDTRHSSIIKDGGTVDVTIPVDGAKSAFVNITVVNPVGQGFLTAWGGGTRPNVSNLNYGAGETICNTSWVPVVNGKIKLYSKFETHIIVDLQAYAK